MKREQKNDILASVLERNTLDYSKDPAGMKCLALARESKAKVGFGAVLVAPKQGVIGKGRNRRSQKGENELLGGGVDYATHAEQAAVIDAMQNGFDVSGSGLFVIGMVHKGPQKGYLSIRPSRNDNYFSCVRCAKMFCKFNILVFIPMATGWHLLSAERALETARELKETGRKLEFTAPPNKGGKDE